MREEFLAYIWKLRLLNNPPFITTGGEQLEVEHPGYLNRDSGPDFFNARIRLEGMEWAGNIELHVKSSEWKQHHHHHDPAYDNVILHVVYEDDDPVNDRHGNRIPTLQLREHINEEKWHQYLNLLQGGNQWVACERMLQRVPPLVIRQWLDRLLAERLEDRCNKMEKLLRQVNNNMDECFYRLLMRSYGLRANTLPFEMLSAALPYSVIARHRPQLLQVEALLFGQSGLLEEADNDYYTIELKREYAMLKRKFGLQPISGHIWKFGRMRPYNFPTLRLAQLAMFLHTKERLTGGFIDSESFDEACSLLETEASGYWHRHYVFGQESIFQVKQLGRSTAEVIMINTLIPFLFLYGKQTHRSDLVARALAWAEQCGPEHNLIIREWAGQGISANHAGMSQGLIHLKQVYCDEKKCINCGIGQYLLQRT